MYLVKECTNATFFQFVIVQRKVIREISLIKSPPALITFTYYILNYIYA